MGSPGDDRRAVFETWVAPLLGRAAAYARALVRNSSDAEDAVQEALLKGYLGLAGYDRSRPFAGWWFAILRNSCLDLIRRRKVRWRLWARASPVAAIDADTHQAEELLACLGQLTPLQREILELRYFGDCSYRDIAETLGIPVGTVMSRLHAARQALADLYRKEEI